MNSLSQKEQYFILKLNVDDIIKSDYDLNLSFEEEKIFLIAEQNSHLINQIEKIRGYKTSRVKEVICVLAKHNKKKWADYTKLISDGFRCNGEKYLRIGKSASQSKDGITVFASEKVYDKIMQISMLDIDMSGKNIVISKYEAQRCLIFSNCTILNSKIPNIVIVEEYTKTLPNQNIKYATEVKKNNYTYREITDGVVDVSLSPFDGCGVHRRFVGEMAQDEIGLDYRPCCLQVRLPFMKGLSVEFDFESYFKDRGIEEIVDVCGNKHKVEDIDCIWNTTMFKAFSVFKEKFGNSAITEYFNVLEKYDFHLGISKYSHHLSHMNLKSRMNFQYLQCLDLYNPRYIQHFDELKQNKNHKYNVLDENNAGRMINLAKYSTDLFEKIAGGDKFYALKFLGVSDSDDDKLTSKYIKAVLINEDMLKDTCVKKYITAKAQKYINQMKVGKIYCSGFYHIIFGDIIGYLEYVSGNTPVGVLGEHTFFVNTIFKNEKCMAFRSPLVCQSEVNSINVVNSISGYEKYFEHFKDQDVAMVNMYDLSMPQMGGADMDGDIVFITNDEIIVNSKIDKKIVVSVDDKATAKKVEYNIENIVDYELRSRDSRIGEITNIATSILNRYTTDEKYKKMNNDNVSFLRLLQGIEIDSIKTGVRWKIPNYLRNYLKQLPYFLMYNYPKKMNSYIKTKRYNRGKQQEEKKKSNAYHSCSPMNELCEYICRWEKERLKWSKPTMNTGVLLVDNSIQYNDEELTKNLFKINRAFEKDWKSAIANKNDGDNVIFDNIINKYRDILYSICENKNYVGNYFIMTSYKSLYSNKLLVWSVFGELILENLTKNSPKRKSFKIEACSDGSKEYLGKRYEVVQA